MARFKTPSHELDQDVTVLEFNEKQHVVLTGVGAGKTWTLKFDGETTANLTNTASAAEVQAGLEGLSNIQPGDVTVSGSAGAGYDVVFAGEYAGENVPQMTGTATEGTVTVTTTTQGGPNPLAVQRGEGDADATDRTDPLDGLSPAAYRAAHPADFGDE